MLCLKLKNVTQGENVAKRGEWDVVYECPIGSKGIEVLHSRRQVSESLDNYQK